MCTRLVLCVHKWLARLTTQRNLLSRIVFGIKTAEKLNPIHAAVTVDTLATMAKLGSTKRLFFTLIKLLILCRVFPSNFPSIQHIHIYIQCTGISAIRGKKCQQWTAFLLRLSGILEAHSAILSHYRAAAWIYYSIDVFHSKSMCFLRCP